MNANSGPLPVVVVGAGPVGVTAANLLAAYGVPCLLIDRGDGVHPQPRAVHLDDEVCRILGRIGVAGGFARISWPALGLRLVDRDLAVLAEFRRSQDAGRHGYPQANMFDQPDLERLLRSVLPQQPAAVRWRENCEVTGLAQRPDHVRLSLADRGTGETEVIEARYVLGCDGAGSLVRREIDVHMRDLGAAQRWLVVDVRTTADLGHWEGVHQLCDVERAATFMRIGPDRYRWEFQLKDWESAEDYASLAELEPSLAPWLVHAGAPGQLDLLRTAEYTFRAQLAGRCRDRRVFLLGDAAHLTPPFIGQGLGAGLRDAANLSWKLAGVLQGGLAERVLDSYESERRPHARSMIRLALLTGFVMTGGGRWMQRVRRAVAPRLRLVPGLRARVVDSATPRLHQPGRAAGPFAQFALAGTLCPNALLDDGRRIDDLAAAFTLVSRVPVPEAQRADVGQRGGVVVTVGPGSLLATWLQRGLATAAVIRPDGTVFAASRDVAELCSHIPGFPQFARALA